MFFPELKSNLQFGHKVVRDCFQAKKFKSLSPFIEAEEHPAFKKTTAARGTTDRLGCTACHRFDEREKGEAKSFSEVKAVSPSG